MQLYLLIFSFIIASSCKDGEELPYKEGACYEEHLKFMASGSPKSYEIYKVKKVGPAGYEIGRYHKNIMYHYTVLTVDNIREKNGK